MRRLAWTLVVSVALVGVLVLAVFPTRAYLDQRRQRRQARAEVARLTAANRSLHERSRLLHTDAEIERLAREQYHLVRPGEEAYAILPPAPTTSVTTVPAGAGPQPTVPAGAGPQPTAPAAGPKATAAPRHRRGFWARLAALF
ncbi:MAG: FtsB family cell division protein [Acidimicrobiales bacterium]